MQKCYVVYFTSKVMNEVYDVYLKQEEAAAVCEEQQKIIPATISARFWYLERDLHE
jgi:hypothetical protein